MSAGPLDFDYTIKPMGDSALLVRLSAKSQPKEPLAGEMSLEEQPQQASVVSTAQLIMLAARRLAEMLQKQAPDREFVAGYDSVLVLFDLDQTDFDRVAQWVRAQIAALAFSSSGVMAETGRLHRLPVVYGGEYGPDLAEVADLKGLSQAEVIALHSAATYSAYLVGFAPGFTYLGGLPARIDLPRRANPRPRVPAGSVAIAGGLTGVYPDALPGGWHLIGFTPVALFVPQGDPPVRILPGDLVQFFPIEAAALVQYNATRLDLAASLVAPGA